VDVVRHAQTIVAVAPRTNPDRSDTLTGGQMELTIPDTDGHRA
jgi:hypothetical protein